MLRELKTFIAVCQHGTFAAAGARTGLTQSAVSAQIQRLEEHLGRALFDRTGRSATLNGAGHETLALAEELLTLYARLEKLDGSVEHAGLLRVGAIASAQISFLVDAVQNFRRELPAWRIRLVPGVSLNLLGQVDSGEIDVAVIIRPSFALPAELSWRSLTTEPFVLLVPSAMAGDCASWRQILKQAPFIRYDRGSFGGRLVERFLLRARLKVNEVLEMDEIQGIVQMVARGIGVALVPTIAGPGGWPAGITAISLGNETFYREVGLVERTHRGQHKAARRFAEITAAAMPTACASAAQ